MIGNRQCVAEIRLFVCVCDACFEVVNRSFAAKLFVIFTFKTTISKFMITVWYIEWKIDPILQAIHCANFMCRAKLSSFFCFFSFRKKKVRIRLIKLPVSRQTKFEGCRERKRKNKAYVVSHLSKQSTSC